jgi:CHASE2 domain-containing sensor protein
MQLLKLRINDGSFATGFSVSFHSQNPATDILGHLPPNPALYGQYLLWQAQYRRLLIDPLGSYDADWLTQVHEDNTDNILQNEDGTVGNFYQEYISQSVHENRNQTSLSNQYSTTQGIETNTSTRASQESCRQLAKNLEHAVADWLKSTEMQSIREMAIDTLAKHQGKIQWVIQLPTPNSQSHHEQSILWQLPWHVWDIFQKYPSIEPTIIPLEFLPIPDVSTQRTQARILAISGDDDRINLEKSIWELKKLEHVQVKHIRKPSADEFISTLRDEQGWDILFFTGHSGTKNSEGWFEINKSTQLDVDRFKCALQKACRQGLKLAIFSSCNGRDLARNLADFNVPTILAMRELIPNQAAQQFIQEFLKVFTNTEKPVALPTAVRQARESLEELTNYPGVTWLPMIFQRSPQALPTWQELCYGDRIQPEQPPLGKPLEQLPKQAIPTASLQKGLPIAPERDQSLPHFSKLRFQLGQAPKIAWVPFVVAALIVTSREMGWLQTVELQAYDQLLQLRPEEKPDPRIVVVMVDDESEQEFQSTEKGSPSTKPPYSISDSTLNALLINIKKYNPFSIGLDIYRDKPTHTEKDFKNLIKTITQLKMVHPICLGDSNVESGTLPPPQLEDVTTFSDLVADGQNGLIRRSLLAMENSIANPECPVPESLSITLASNFLNKNHLLAIDATLNPYQVQGWTAGYHKLDSTGFQIPLNYRAKPDLHTFNAIAAKNILADKFDHSLLENRIILIGSTGNTAKRLEDMHKTPYGEMPGVFIHAQMTSQILSFLLDKRPLIWSLSPWGDASIIFICGIPSLLIFGIKRTPQFLLIVLVGAGGIISLAFVGLWQFGAWLPLIPSVIVFAASSVTMRSLYKNT